MPIPMLHPSCFLLAALTLSVAAADIPTTNAKVHTVTVYGDRAEVVRHLSATVEAGDHSLTFENLPGATDLSSVRVDGKGAFTLIDIRGERIQTKEVADERVLKLKRALRYAYLDFSTPEKRLADCERELAINRRFTPQLYLGLRRITCGADGALQLDGEGEVLDGVVEMRRFRDEDLFSRVVEEGRATPALVTRLAGVIAASHEAAEVASTGGAEAFGRVLALNETALRASAPVAADRIEALCAGLRALLDRHAALLDARSARDCVRAALGGEDAASHAPTQQPPLVELQGRWFRSSRMPSAP